MAWPKYFVCEYALLLRELIDLGYPPHAVLSPARRCFARHPHLFGQASAFAVYSKVTKLVFEMRPVFDPTRHAVRICLHSAETTFDSFYPSHISGSRLPR